MKRILSFILLIIAILLAGALILIVDSTVSPAPPTAPPRPMMTADTASPYKRMNVGSSKKLQGNCVLITLFLSDTESSFTDLEKEEQLSNLQTAVDFLSAQAAQYAQSPSFIYNTEDTVIEHTIHFTVPQSSSASWPYPYDNFVSKLRSQYDFDGIMRKYNADNLALIIIVNKRGDGIGGYAEPSSHNKAYLESAIIYAIDANDRAYAHEILHLFGAIDLYKLENERLALAEQYFSNDLMLHPYASECSIGSLDAYLIGWTDQLDEAYEVFLKDPKNK